MSVFILRNYGVSDSIIKGKQRSSKWFRFGLALALCCVGYLHPSLGVTVDVDTPWGMLTTSGVDADKSVRLKTKLGGVNEIQAETVTDFTSNDEPNSKGIGTIFMLTREGSLYITGFPFVVERVEVVPAAKLLILESSLALFAIAEGPLTTSRHTKTKNVANRKDLLRKLSLDVYDGWRVNGDAGSITGIGQSKTASLSFGIAGPKLREIPIPDSEVEILGAVMDPTERFLLAEVMRDLDPDVVFHEAMLFDLKSGSMKMAQDIRSIDDLEICWSAPSQGFLIFDPARGTLWLWATENEVPRLLFSPPDDSPYSYRELVSGIGPIVLLLGENMESGKSVLLPIKTGADPMLPVAITSSGVRFSGCHPHPTMNIIACFIEEDEETPNIGIALLDTRGNVRARHALPLGDYDHRLRWSADGCKVYMAALEQGLVTWSPPTGIIK